VKFCRETLSNGLEIVAETNAEAHSTALGFFVRTGSRDETDDVAGVSHFLEHMMFKGTPTRSADDVNREFDEMGAHYNAFTNEEATVYYAAVLPEYQHAAVELWGDILRPSLRAEDFETEKQVILEEIQMYEDQPPFGADEKARAAFFGKHPLSRSVLGTPQSIQALPVEKMLAYFQRRYSPTNITLVAAGRVDFAALVRSAQQCCGHWEPIAAGRDMPAVQAQHGFQVLHKASAAQQYALGMAAGPTAVDHDRYAAKLLATVLGDDSGSRLFWELVDPGLAETASLSHYEYDGAGMFASFLACDPEYVAENLQAMHDVFQTAQNDGITAAELEQAKSKVRSRIVLSGERPRGRLFLVGGDWIQRHEYRSVGDDLQAFAAVSLDEVHAVLDRFPLLPNTTFTIGPLTDVPAPE